MVSGRMMGVPSRRVLLGLGLVVVFCLGLWMQVNAASDNPSMTFVKKTIASHSIVIFSKSYCPMSLSRGHPGSNWLQINFRTDDWRCSCLLLRTSISAHWLHSWYCKRAKSVFKELKERPFVVELDLREDGGKIQAALSQLVGRRTVPQVFIDGEHIGGSDDTVEAYNNGKLQKLLNAKQSGDWQHDNA